MTKEAAKRILYVYRAVNLVDASHREAFDMAIKTIEQQPCEDAVSLAQVFEILENLMGIPYELDRPINKDDVIESMDAIRALPPVTPARKKGKWVIKATGFPPEPMTVCSECGFDRDYYIFPRGCHKMNYCPNCGAKMVKE